MRNLENSLAVSSIIFTSNDNDVLLKGDLKRGQLAYETELIISQSQLNQVLNTLSKQNDFFAIEEYLQSEIIGRDEKLFFADFGHLSNSLVDVQSILGTQECMQIRA